MPKIEKVSWQEWRTWLRLCMTAKTMGIDIPVVDDDVSSEELQGFIQRLECRIRAAQIPLPGMSTHA